MLKKALNYVLGSPASSTYPRRYACGADFASALLNHLFEHSFKSFILRSSKEM
jgi:hypothetical protein